MLLSTFFRCQKTIFRHPEHLELAEKKILEKILDLQAMKERKAEIKVHKESLILQKRFALSDCSEIRASIMERKSKVQNLQTRYDTCIAAMGNNEDSEGNEVTTTLLITQRAQEKYMLQEQGDKLDATIRRTEQEIRSMENTLRVINACNDKYKMSLGPVDEEGREQAERRKIDEELFNAMETMRQRREQLERTSEDLEKMRTNYETSIDDVRRAKEEKDNKLWNVANLERQITEQNERILRADKSLRKLFKDIQRICECTNDEMILLQEVGFSRDFKKETFSTFGGIFLYFSGFHAFEFSESDFFSKYFHIFAIFFRF